VSGWGLESDTVKRILHSLTVKASAELNLLRVNKSTGGPLDSTQEES